MTGLTEGRSGVAAFAKRLALVSRPTSRFLIYSLSPLLFLGLAIMVALMMRTPLPPWNEFVIYSGLPPLGLPAVLLLVLLFNGFGEEAGWRGFALEPLQRRYGPVIGTLILAGFAPPTIIFPTERCNGNVRPSRRRLAERLFDATQPLHLVTSRPQARHFQELRVESVQRRHQSLS